jgi:hypothetical protein
MLDAIVSEVESRAGHFLGAQPVRVQAHLLTMSRHRCYESGRLLALLFADDAPAPAVVACFQRDAQLTERLDREHAILQALEASRLAPRPLGLVPIQGRSVLFQEALSGPHAGGQLAQTAWGAARDPQEVRDRLEAQLAAAGRFLSALQGLSPASAPASPHPGVGASGPAYCETFGLGATEAELLTGLLNDYEAYLAALGPVWVHGDLTLSNLAIAGESVRAFDWEYGGQHLDRHRDAAHLAYYAFVSAFHHGLFPGQDFHRAFAGAFLAQNNGFAPLVRQLMQGLSPVRYRQALLACLVQDALLQSVVSLVFAPENRNFHASLIQAVLGYDLYREELAAAHANTAAVESRLAEETARSQGLEARAAGLDAELASLVAERAALMTERALLFTQRDGLDGRVQQLEAEKADLQARHDALGLHAHTLGEQLERINSRWPMRLYRRIRRGFSR